MMMMILWRPLCVLALFASVGVSVESRQHKPQGTPDHMSHRFDDPARFAASFDDPARDSWQLPERVIAALGLTPDASVADIGAGTGYFSVRLAKAVPHGTVYAADIEASMVEYIRKRATNEGLKNVVTVLADAKSPNVPNPVDVAIIVDTYHHIPDRVTYFRNLKTFLAPSARVAVIDFRKDSPEGPPPQFRFEADQIIGEMQQAGFRLDAKHDFLSRQHFLIFRSGS